MKKSYLMIAAAAALFAACSSNDTFKEVNEDVAISFEGKYINKVTRAELTNDWFTTANNKFGVYGFKGSYQLFDDEEVTRESSTWTHPTVRFWDKASTDYSFYAYAPYGATQTFTVASKTFAFASLPVISDIESANADIAISTPITGYSYASTVNDTHGAGHVEFEFNHILSKLAFKVKTSANSNYAEIKVTNIALDFPSGTATWTQGNSGVTGATTYQSYTAKDAVSISNNTEVTDLTKFETTVFSGTTAALTSTAADIVDANTTTNKAKVFIVTPVTGSESGNGSEHVFGIKVTYNVQYKKLEGNTYVNDGNPEEGCIATGVIGGGNTDATRYKPTQNSSYVVTINVNPDQIEFCVDKINNWADATGRDVEVK